MDKRILAKVPRPAPMPTEEKYKPSERFIATEDLTIGDEQVLVLNVFMQDKGDTDLVCIYRTFMTPDDYITQDLRTDKTKWITGAFHNAWEFGNKSKQFVSMEHMDRFRKFLREYKCDNPWKKNPNIWDDCEVYQKKVLADRLKAKHKRETDVIDARMKVLGDIPREFFYWVEDEALSKSQYIFYTRTSEKRDHIRCSCSVCNQIFEGDRKKLGVKNNAEGECPMCASRVTYKSYGAFPKKKTDGVYVTYVEPLPEGFCLRYLLAERTFTKEPGGIQQHSVDYCELVREFVRYPKTGKAITDGYQYDHYKMTHELRWCHEKVHYTIYGGSTLYECYSSCLYPGNLPEAWAHTPMKYSGLEILSRNTPGEHARYWDAIYDPEGYRAIEILAKSGLYRMCHGMLHSGGSSWGAGRGLNEKGTDLGSILRLNMKDHPNKTNIRILRQIDASVAQLVLMQHIDREGIRIEPDVLVRYFNIFNVNSDLLKPRNRHASLHKICRYIEDQQEREKRRKLTDIGKDWCDYLSWCRELRIDLTDPYHYFPPDFYKEHDRVAKDYQVHLDEVKAEKKRQREAEAKKKMEAAKAAMAEIFRSNVGVDAFSIKGKGLILVVPTCAQDIRDEGEALHHCVGSYIDRVAKGETNIFFVRKADAPTVPFFTMEFKNGKVVQCRGNRNCGMPPEVEAFTKVFEQKMQEAVKAKTNNTIRRVS